MSDFIVEKDPTNGETPLKANEARLRPAYEPTQEEVEAMKMKPDHFKVSGDAIFHTIQGEGSRQGNPITFIRLQHCNLACGWCDAFYTWMPEAEEYWKEAGDIHIDDVHAAIRQAQEQVGIEEERHVNRVLWTGGEPLLQQRKIVQFMQRHPQYFAEIETNGTVMPSEWLLEHATTGRKGIPHRIAFNVSPKIPSSGNEGRTLIRPRVLEMISLTDDPLFKFVCSTEQDIYDVLNIYGELIPFEYISIMPEGVTKERNQEVYERLMPMILKYGLRTHPRGHTVMFEEAKREI